MVIQLVIKNKKSKKGFLEQNKHRFEMLRWYAAILKILKKFKEISSSFISSDNSYDDESNNKSHSQRKLLYCYKNYEVRGSKRFKSTNLGSGFRPRYFSTKKYSILVKETLSWMFFLRDFVFQVFKSGLRAPFFFEIDRRAWEHAFWICPNIFEWSFLITWITFFQTNTRKQLQKFS